MTLPVATLHVNIVWYKVDKLKHTAIIFHATIQFV